MSHTWFFDDDGYTRFPLYHGTSSHFMDSIRTYGLGGRNIVKESRALEMYHELYAVRKRRFGPVAYADGGSWGYGDVYLTAYEGRARRFRSELFGLIRADMHRMKRTLRDELLNRYPEVAACLSGKHKLVVLRLPRLHISDLLGWNSDDPSDSDSMCTFEDYQETLDAYQNGYGCFVPTPTLRLRNPIYEFEIVELPDEAPPPPRRIKSDDELWPLPPFDEWLLDFFRWAVIPSSSKADSFWKGFIEHTIKYVSNTDVNRALRQLGYVFPDGFRNEEPYQRVRWKWRSREHKEFLLALFNNNINNEHNDLSKYAALAAEFYEIRRKVGP